MVRVSYTSFVLMIFGMRDYMVLCYEFRVEVAWYV